MKLPKVTARRLIVVVAVIASAQGLSTAYRSYLRRQGKADEFTFTEGMYRRRANVCEELAAELREVAELAREVAKTASSNFERSRWQEMARSEEEKAARLDHEALQMMTKADHSASQAAALSRLAWRLWIPEPR